jgi:hypothetical protein
VGGGRPSSNPAAASTNAPEQTDSSRAPRWCAARKASSIASGGGSSRSRQLGMTMVPARDSIRT